MSLNEADQAVKGLIHPLDPSDQAQLNAVAELHMKLIPEGPIAGLGLVFLKRFYYSKLVASRLIHCDLYRAGDTYVGFVAYTSIPDSFIRAGAFRFPWPLAATLLVCFFERPARLPMLVRFLLNRSLGKSIGVRAGRPSDQVGEMLSFGVIAPYRNLKTGGESIPQALFKRGLSVLKKEGVLVVRLVVLKRNKAAILFYNFLGGTLRERCKEAYWVTLEL